MGHEIDAIAFNDNLRETYFRYLFTSNPVSDQEPELKELFRKRLEEEFGVIKGPLIHCTPCYKPSYSVKELVASGAGALTSSLLKLPLQFFDPERPLYSHQVEAIKRVKAGNNLVVATGTGSGKTESFLLPILDDILSNPGPGLRAIIIYPMNALADDQLFRLRNLLEGFPEVTFGRYTGDTPNDLGRGEVHPGPPNERYTRGQLREEPPNILLTNFAMLEYLLLRPVDSGLFNNHQLKFLVLDEAHTYSGAQGIEIALLIRRLKQYLGLVEPGAMQFILTSATLGDEDDAIAKVAGFASDLTGGVFDVENILLGDTIDSFNTDLEDKISLGSLAKSLGETDDFDFWGSGLADVDKLSELLRGININPGQADATSVQRFLYDLLSNCEDLALIHDLCKSQPSNLAEICSKLGYDGNDANAKALRWLLTMGSNARSGPDASPLLPTRMHYFTRGLAGATVCVNDSCGSKKGREGLGWSDFFLDDRNLCPSCECHVLPLMTCVHCGLPVLKAVEVSGDIQKWRKTPDYRLENTYRVLTWHNNLDEEIQEDDENDNEGTNLVTLCLKCGAIKSTPGDLSCCDEPVQRQLWVLHSSGENDELPMCKSCGGTGGSFGTVLREFRTSEDAPTAVLAETTIRNLPFDPEKEGSSDLPAHGRNLLVFSDSRQRAAFFAPYLGQTTAETIYMGPLEKAIEVAEGKESRPVTFEEVAREFEPLVTGYPVVALRNWDNLEEKYTLVQRSQLRSQHRSDLRKQAQISLFKHFCSSQKQKTTLAGMGIAALNFDFSEYERKQFPLSLPEIFDGNVERGWQVIHAMLEVFVQRIAVEFPDFVRANQQIVSFGPPIYTFHLADSGRKERGQRQVYRWNPYTSKAKRSLVTSRQLNVLCKALGKSRDDDRELLDGLLNKIWDLFTEGLLVNKPEWPGEFRLDRYVIQVTKDCDWHACSKCGRVSTLGLLGFCTVPDCSGIPRQLNQEAFDAKFGSNHYRQRYLSEPLPLEVKEHTAQLTNKVGKDYQERFMKGLVNVLSSSTTFEMGIDVGDLKAVLLRNIPPTTSSYIQRAGRAGRRKDGISLAISYARNVPHDQFHFDKPRQMITGEVPVPYVNIENQPLTQRHCNSLLLGYFLRDFDQVPAEELSKLTVGDFFVEEHSFGSLLDQFVTWGETPEKIRRLCHYLGDVIPHQCKIVPQEAIVESLLTLRSNVYRDLVKARITGFDEQTKILKNQLGGADGKQLGQLARHISSLARLKDQFLNERLINFLSGASWLPGYAFPQDIVKLTVRQEEHASRMRLERDREIGISEYAPGSEIVADGLLFKSGGVEYNSKEPEVRWYCRCPECRKIQTGLETEPPARSCDRCGTALSGVNSARLYLRPDGFTTLVSEPAEPPKLNRKRPTRVSEVFLLEGASDEDFKPHSIKGISCGIRKEGKLFRANSGREFSGFEVCRSCGRWIENTGRVPNEHETPWGSKCRGRLIRIDLAHEIVTDILQLRFDACLPPAPDVSNKAFWLSLLTAVLHGASDNLGISSQDLDGTFHGWNANSRIGELVIYDRIPGGAGHVKKILENLDIVLKGALERVEECSCQDLEASCYACLRSYSNQFYWEELSRRPVIEFLSGILA